MRGLGQRRVREHELPGREVARVVLGDARPVAKERDLDAERLAVARAHPAGHVPPLGAVRGVAAVVARERAATAPAAPRDSPSARARRHRRGEERQREERAPLHQSSFTARTASAPIACRPDEHRGERRERDDREAEQREVAPRHGELHAPVERLSIDDVDQDQADRRAERRCPRRRPIAAVAAPSVASIAPICRRVMPRWRSTPNSRRRASTSAPNADDRPMSPIATAASSSA